MGAASIGAFEGIAPGYARLVAADSVLVKGSTAGLALSSRRLERTGAGTPRAYR